MAAFPSCAYLLLLATFICFVHHTVWLRSTRGVHRGFWLRSFLLLIKVKGCVLPLCLFSVVAAFAVFASSDPLAAFNLLARHESRLRSFLLLVGLYGCVLILCFVWMSGLFVWSGVSVLYIMIHPCLLEIEHGYV